jgi:hypothetical protein
MQPTNVDVPGGVWREWSFPGWREAVEFAAAEDKKEKGTVWSIGRVSSECWVARQFIPVSNPKCPELPFRGV